MKYRESPIAFFVHAFACVISFCTGHYILGSLIALTLIDFVKDGR
jgi:hypothetical protein